VFLNTRRRFGEGAGDGDGAAEEIDVGGQCRRWRHGVTRSGGEGGAPGTGSSCGRSARRGKTRGDPHSRRGAPGGRQWRGGGTSWWRRVCEGREVQSMNECARVHAGALGRTFIERGGGEGATTG
jgi:hypothetical protein